MQDDRDIMPIFGLLDWLLNWKTKYIEIEAVILRETKKAYKLKYNEREAWFPKSAVKSVHRKGNLITMKVKTKFFQSKFGEKC